MKLTETIKNKIILEISEGVPKTEVAKKYDISRPTLDKILKDNPETLQKFTVKKEEIEQDIIEYMNQRRGKIVTIMDKYLDALANDEKIDSATLSQLTTALGTLIDKWTMVKERDGHAEVRLAYLVPQDTPEEPPEEIEEESDE